ncbi:MAG TPA: hypothetical protein VF705_09845, partial [Longimicrobium sp.]
TAVVTAASGDRTGRTVVTVSPDDGSDVTGPLVTGVSFSRTTLDVSAGADSFDVLVHARDSQSPIIGIQVLFAEGVSGRTVQCADVTRVSGTDQDGVFRCRVVMRQGEANRAWQMLWVMVADGLRNNSQLEEAELRAGGYPRFVEVTGGSADLSPPVLVGLSLDRDSVWTAGKADTVNLSMQLQDASGLIGVQALVLAGGVSQSVQCGEVARTSGSSRNGTWRCPLVFPRYSANGDWTVAWVMAVDSQFNNRTVETPALAAAGYPTTIHVIDPDQDVTAPQITAFSVHPDTVHTGSADGSATVTLHVTDAQTGVTGVQVLVRSDASTQSVQCGNTSLVSGSAADGTWTCALTFPQGGALGTWTVLWVMAADGMKNNRQMETPAMQAAGWTTQIVTAP